MFLGNYPIGGGEAGYPYRPSEEESKLDLDVNSPLSEGEEDEDDFKDIKKLIEKKNKKSN